MGRGVGPFSVLSEVFILYINISPIMITLICRSHVLLTVGMCVLQENGDIAMVLALNRVLISNTTDAEKWTNLDGVLWLCLHR